MTDPHLTAARKLADDAFDVLRGAVFGLPAEALDWAPPFDGANSITVLATHAMHATRLLLSLAVGLPAPARDREGEFAARAVGPDEMLNMIESLAGDCHAALDTSEPIDWGTVRQFRRADGTVRELTAAFALMHAVDHLRGHADEAALTRHLWEACAETGDGR